jgi:hypothetical protein
MQRTTIMLPRNLKMRASRHAGRLGISVGELIRQSLAAIIYRPTDRAREDPLFADQAVFGGQAPRDLAKHHDRHLYGEPPA